MELLEDNFIEVEFLVLYCHYLGDFTLCILFVIFMNVFLNNNDRTFLDLRMFS